MSSSQTDLVKIFGKRNKVVPAAYIVFKRGNQVLLLKRANTGYNDGKYSLPAGHVERGESLLQAAVREAMEEVGVDIRPQDLKLVHIINRSSDYPVLHERLDFFFMADSWQGEVTICEPDKCTELRWANWTALPPNMIREVRQALDNIREGQIYSEIDL